MLPIPGESYTEYSRRLAAFGDTPLTEEELLAAGYEVTMSGLIIQLTGPGEVFRPAELINQPTADTIPDTGGPGPGITPVTVYYWVWCYNPSTGTWEGPWTQMLDAYWEWGLVTITQMVDANAKSFCAGAYAQTSPRAPLPGETTDYDWAIQSPLGLQYSRGI